MNFEEIFQSVNKKEFGDWMGREDCQVLHAFAEKVEGGLIVEIGTWLGKSLSILSKSSPTSSIIGIDPYLPPYTEEYFRLQENIKGLDNVEHFRKTSNEMYKTWFGSIDLLHVDGDHRYQQVKWDLRWLKFVRPGGVALFHDYTTNTLPAVKKAIDQSGYEVEVISGFAKI